MKPYVESGNITDRLIDRFVAFIWDQVMQQVYAPVVAALGESYSSGEGDSPKYRGILDSLKTWDMGRDSLSFKDSGTVADMAEKDGSVLFDYLRYGMDYIKLVRRVLGSIAASALIDPETGNILHYSNDNEIVQFNIPNELIELRVAQNSSLLTGTGV